MKNANINVLNYIVKDINLSVARLGINTQLSLVEKESYVKTQYWTIDSTPFQIMPMIFKDIKLTGDVYILEDEKKEDVIKVAVRLDYRYHCFDGGSNGHQLGLITYEIDKHFWNQWDGKDREKIAKYEINKVQGLEI